VSDLKKMRARAEYHRSIDLSHIDNIGLDQYAALIACAEALEKRATGGHDLETCDLVRKGEPCSCGYAESRTALAQLRAAP
jgi:hypothetical protein